MPRPTTIDEMLKLIANRGFKFAMYYGPETIAVRIWEADQKTNEKPIASVESEPDVTTLRQALRDAIKVLVKWGKARKRNEDAEG